MVAGFVSWWATGVDDVLLLGLVLRGQPRPLRRAVIVGNVVGVLLILAVSGLIVLGVLTALPALMQGRVLGVPLLQLAGAIPIVIGLRALLTLRRGNAEPDEEAPSDGILNQAGAGVVGFQVYVLNSADDLIVHVGVFAGAAQSVSGIVAYSVGVLLGELSSILAARWLAARMQTRRTLEVLAALAVIVIGVLVLIGAFEPLS
jgi:cadmium resistance protein CadD (predicted permease)